MHQLFRLDVHTIDIENVEYGDSTGVSARTLTVSRDEIEALVLELLITGFEILQKGAQ